MGNYWKLTDTREHREIALKDLFKKYGIGCEPVYHNDGKLHNELTVNGQDAIKEIQTWFYEWATTCESCGKKISRDCAHCQHLWST